VQLVARQPLELVILVRVQAPEPFPRFNSPRAYRNKSHPRIRSPTGRIRAYSARRQQFKFDEGDPTLSNSNAKLSAEDRLDIMELFAKCAWAMRGWTGTPYSGSVTLERPRLDQKSRRTHQGLTPPRYPPNPKRQGAAIFGLLVAQVEAASPGGSGLP
jgi:hypothetical protein